MIGPGGFMAGPKAAPMAEPCDYNPLRKEAGYGGKVEGDCPNEATVSLGVKPNWHLCESCASLPAFKRFRRRAPLRRAQPQPAEPK